MNRDPLRQQITDALNEKLDGDLFEACMCDVLRSQWPTLIPVPGGNDAGSDGAWANEDGRGILVATTQENVIGNVTRNLKQHVAKGQLGKQVLVATSRRLSGQQCRNIEKRIRELGFVSAHYPYTQQAVTDQLYHNSRWLKELLGLAGGTSALSTIPRGSRPFRDLPPLGRESEIEWLRNTVGDRLLIGQPGIGKTFLCQALVNEGLALFATSDDITRLADAIRDQQPSAIIVEDAHLKLDLLDSLRHFREETGAEFAIIADCWPGAIEVVSNTLQISRVNQLELQSLSGETIVELVNAAGIHGPDILMHHIVRQSMGCPGRAALLSYLCLANRNFKDIVDGRAFANWAYSTFSSLVGERSRIILAGFAIGGECGMSASAVASILGYPLGDVLQTLSKLALGGVIVQRNDDVYCVLPEPFRIALARDHFFSDGPKLSFRRFLDATPSPASAVQCVIHAYRTGARIPLTDVFELVENVDQWTCWETFLWIGELAASMACLKYPKLLNHYPQPLLHNVPEKVLPILFKSSVSDDRALHSSPDHPLREIEGWVQEVRPPSADCMKRRETLWRAVKTWLEEGICQRVGLNALAAVVNPKWATQHQKPGDRRSFRFQRGCLPPENLRSLAKLWIEILDYLSSIDIQHWPQLFEAAHNWFYPANVTRELSDEYHEICQNSTRDVLARFKKMADGRPGVLSSIKAHARHLDLKVEVDIDSDYACLFPDDPIDDERGFAICEKEQGKAARTLAEKWTSADPHSVVKKLIWCINESKSQEHVWPDYADFVASLIAQETDAPAKWLTVTVDSGAPAAIVHPFLNRVVESRTEGWLEAVLKCLRSSESKSAGLGVIVVAAEQFKEDVEEEIESVAVMLSGVIKGQCRDVKIPHHRLQRFLSSRDPGLAAAAAEGIWDARRNGHMIPSDLMSTWRSAIIDGKVRGHKVAEICKVDAVFAFDWLCKCATDSSYSWRYDNDAVPAAVAALSIAQRAAVLKFVTPARYASQGLVAAIIGNNTELFHQLLADTSLEPIHMDPLCGEPDDEWADLAVVALNHGYSEQTVANAAFREIKVEQGPTHLIHAGRAKKWEALLSHTDARIRKVAAIGRDAEITEGQQWEQREKGEDFLESYG